MIERKSLRIFQLSVFALAVEWIVFGSAHFTQRAATEAQIPPELPSKTLIAIVTGMVEVTTGILILFPRTRKWAAIVSLVLLGLFLPSIYRMLAFDEAIRGSVEWRNAVRVLLVPNHVFLALCAIYLVRWPERPPSERLGRRESASKAMVTFTGGGATFIVALVMLMSNIAGFLVLMSSPLYDTTAALWALMCLAVGGLTGFLFGVPRVALEGVEGITHRPNSNIEVISDWLTKIIVGVGLLQFHKLGDFLDSVSADLGRAVGRSDAARAGTFAKALIIYFFVAGAIQGYLLTRMYLAERFEELELPSRDPASASGRAAGKVRHASARLADDEPQQSPG